MGSGTKILRETNEKRVLKLLRKHEVETRQELVTETGLGKNTISVIIDRFLNEGIVEEQGTILDNSVGRPKKKIALIENAIKIIGIRIEHDYIKFSLVNYRNSELKSHVIKNNNVDDLDSVKKILKREISSLIEEHPEIIGIGVALTGIVDSERGIVYKSTQLKWENVNLQQLLSSFFNGIVCIVSLVRAISLVSPYTDLDSTFYIRIRRGLGGSLIINNEINFGKSWLAGEIGQLPISVDKSIKIETLLNERQVKKELTSSKDQREIFIEKGEISGLLIGNLILICDPGRIVLDGFYCTNEDFQKSVKEYLVNNFGAQTFENTKLVFTEGQSEEQPELGVAQMVINKFENIKLEK